MAKKKRRSSGAGPTGAEKQEARQKRLDEKRQARAEALERQAKQARRERFVRWVLLAFIIVGGVWFFFLRNAAPTEIGGHSLLASSQAGVGEHVEDPVTYDTTPPVAGAHSKTPAPCGVHATQIPNENQVHTLEHGGVGLLYDPSLDIDQIRELEDIVNGFDSHVFSEPYADMGSPIVIVAWGYRMPLDEVDRPAIEEFIDEFRQKGPEEIDCPNSEADPFVEGDSGQPSDSVTPGVTATISPGAEVSPSPDGQQGTPEPDKS